MNLYSLLDGTARRFGERGAVYAGGELVRTWAGLQRRALRLAGALHRHHGAAARIAIASENRPEYFELLFGIWAAGMAAVPINYKLHGKEMAQIIDDSESAAVFASPRLATDLPPLLAAGCRPIAIDGAEYAALFDAEPIEPATAAPGALAWLFYTSGTTGRSKGAMLTHRNLLAATIAHLADVEALDQDASQLHVAPLSHGSGIYMLPSVARGARQVVPASSAFDAAEFLALCDFHPACTTFLAPTMVQRLRLEIEQSKRPRPANLRTIVYGGGPMYVEELKKSMAVFGPVFVQIYGQGEAPMTITSLSRAEHAIAGDELLGSVGYPRSGVEVRVVDATGVALPPGETGEIICRGDVVMAGYWNNPGATAEALQDGWLHTGDIGSVDARGCLTLRDRSKDLIISGGSNIYPREVEEALVAHPGVSEVCVVGQADDEWGEVVVAFVVPVPGLAVSAQQLDAQCLERIARYKRPKRYLFVEALPKNSYGKVLKRELRERLATKALEDTPGQPGVA